MAALLARARRIRRLSVAPIVRGVGVDLSHSQLLCRAQTLEASRGNSPEYAFERDGVARGVERWAIRHFGIRVGYVWIVATPIGSLAVQSQSHCIPDMSAVRESVIAEQRLEPENLGPEDVAEFVAELMPDDQRRSEVGQLQSAAISDVGAGRRDVAS